MNERLRTAEEQAQRDREACEGKVRYATKTRAKESASIQSRGGRKIWTYKCDHCGGWHLTSHRPESRRWWNRQAKELQR